MAALGDQNQLRAALCVAIMAAVLWLTMGVSPAVSAPVPRVLEVRGYWYDMYGVDRAISRAGGAVMTQSWPGKNTVAWYSPASTDDLARYSLVIVDGVYEGNFSDETSSLHQQALKDYVARGGSLLILGGFYPFPAAGTSEMAQVMPLTFAGASTRIHGVFPIADAAGIRYSTSSNPHVLWMYEGTTTSSAHAILTAGGKPLLVEGNYGKGRVAVFAGTVMGAPDPGTTPFWQWDEWPRVLGDTLTWLLASDGAQAPDNALPLVADIQRAGGQPTEELAAYMRAADLCKGTSTARDILDSLSKASWNLLPADADAIDSRLQPYIDRSCSDIAGRLAQGDDIGRISLGLRLLGQSHAPGALATLTAALTSGDVNEGGGPDTDLTPDVGNAVDPEDRSGAIKLAAVIGLGRLGDPSAVAALTMAQADARKAVSKPGSFPITPTYGDLIVDHASIARLRCGDSSAASDAIAAIVNARTTLAATMIQMSIPLEGRGPHEMEKLKRLNAKRAYAAAYAAKSDADLALIGLPDSVLPAVATAFAQSDEPWAVPIAGTVFGRAFQPIIPASIAAILKTAKQSAIADLAGPTSP